MHGNMNIQFNKHHCVEYTMFRTKCLQVPGPHTHLRSPKPVTSTLPSINEGRESIKMYSMHSQVSFSHDSTCNFIWISRIPLCTIIDHKLL
jgi:hypothetical protein